ncbi:hypothetical protein Bbelb_264520 [Branchiostoma belcheri]|nr:hypothetical protein Bbelb_264520 [Branchiostoma belcheri]
MKAGKQGLAMTRKQWATLKTLPLLGAILDDTKKFEPKMYDLGSERYATVQILNGQPYVTLHQHYGPHGAPATDPPMKKERQWQDLENKMEAVDQVLAAMENGKLPTDKDMIQSPVVY